ncbi:histidine kinase, partial [Streptomyces sp. NPDC005904]|uniref:sensor histidine kinase n=1 Tax=Streptomyces sp. NPDC005904 TaxID=3154570 RepID=UPI0033DDC5A1
MHTAFFLLLGSSLVRFLLRHPVGPRTPWIIALSVCLALLYLSGPALGARSAPHRLAWLILVVAAWSVLVVLAPSFAWCAVPLFYTGLRTLPPRAALFLVAVLTAFVVAAQLRLAGRFDPNLLFAPPAWAAVASAVFLYMQRQAARQRVLIDDLLRTRRELAATERRAGTLAERQRLSMEIHDTLAQGLSSQQMLLQAADRLWDTDPARAHAHVRTAESITERGLAEARRFVRARSPPGLERGSLAGALERLGASSAGPRVRVSVSGTPVELPTPYEVALLRVAQSALANAVRHAGATRAEITLTFMDGSVTLDVVDDGRGFDPAAGEPPQGAGDGGFG